MQTNEQPRTWALLERLGAVLFAALLTAVAFAFVGVINVSIQAWALNLATAAGLGLVSGLSSRLALHNYRWMLRLMAALAAAVVGMVFVGWLTWGFAGVTPGLAGRTQVDWAGLGRVGLGILGASLAMRAWVRSSRGDSRPPSAREIDQPAPPGPIAPPTTETEGQRVHRSEPHPTSASRGRRPGLPRLPSITRISNSWATRLGSWRRSTLAEHPSGIRLTGAEEHRCPYCLEPVTPGDPRGVVECPVCHTQHHADCWAVTGVCQVPHHHA